MLLSVRDGAVWVVAAGGGATKRVVCVGVDGGCGRRLTPPV